MSPTAITTDGPIRSAVKRIIPPAARRRLLRLYQRAVAWPRVDRVRFGSLRRLTPISRSWGAERGQPIDRYYIDGFLQRHAQSNHGRPGAIRGRVLEIGDARYVERFGESEAMEQVDILDPDPANPVATIRADLADASDVPADSFDCIICAQTLLLIYDVHSAVRTLHRILKPAGTLIVTVPGISQICGPEMKIWGDYWRFTALSLRRLLEEQFEPNAISVEAYGNVLSATAFLYGLAAEELDRSELDVVDPSYQLLIAATAVKGSGST